MTLRNNDTKYSLTNVDVTVKARESGAQIQFTAEKVVMQKTICTDEHDMVFSTEVQARIECIQPDTFSVVVHGPKTEPVPTYNAAMGDAAAQYVRDVEEGIHCVGEFRWAEVWKRMWAAQKQ